MPRRINVNVLNSMGRTMNNPSEKKEFMKLRNDHTLQKNKVKSLENANKILLKEVAVLKKQNSEASLKKNPIVARIINEKIKTSEVKIKNLENKLKLKEKVLLQYKYLKDIKPMVQKDFNNFIANSVRALQENLSSNSNSDYDFMIRDVQIEALVSTEKRAGKMAFIIPTSTQLQNIDANRLQKLKYSLSMVPKVD